MTDTPKIRTHIPWALQLRLMLECSVVGRHLGTFIAIGAVPLAMAVGPILLVPLVGRNVALAITMAVVVASMVYLATGNKGGK